MRKTRAETLDERLERMKREPHHPSICPTKGMFGRNCRLCDPGVKPETTIRRVPLTDTEKPQ